MIGVPVGVADPDVEVGDPPELVVAELDAVVGDDVLELELQDVAMTALTPSKAIPNSAVLPDRCFTGFPLFAACVCDTPPW
jgi:hypothetical protein